MIEKRRNLGPEPAAARADGMAYGARAGVLPADRAGLIAVLHESALFAGLPYDAIDRMAGVARPRAYRWREFIWHRDEAVTDIVLIQSGFAKLVRRHASGTSETYGLYGPGDVIGLFDMCAGMKHSTDAITVNKKLTAVCVDAAACRTLAESSAVAGANLCNELTRFIQALIKNIEVMCAGQMPQRLAVLLTHLTDRYGVEGEGNVAVMPFSLTLSQIAELIGARQETVARVLGDWKRAGWLTTHSRCLSFNRLDKIRELSSPYS